MIEPPIGMKCADCGCCRATVKAGDDWICWECDAGTPCKAKTAPQPIRPAITTKKITYPTQGDKMQVRSGNSGKYRVSEDVRKAIISADPAISNCELARRFGISDPTVSLIRKKAGIVLVKGNRGPYKPREPRIAAQAPEHTETPSALIPSRSNTGDSGFSLTLTVTFDAREDLADILWKTFSAQEKRIAVQSVLQLRLGTL